MLLEPRLKGLREVPAAGPEGKGVNDKQTVIPAPGSGVSR
jgi:hypothetical protein